MITQDTAVAIWHAYREIDAGEKLLADMAKERERQMADKHAPTLRDAFGHLRQLQLGIPSGENSHRLFQVSPVLAESVIRAHIQNKRTELVEANERARIELAEPANLHQIAN
ncbi:MAG: hypothetical protein HEQ39_09815 [Rhizobacter sp.]